MINNALQSAKQFNFERHQKFWSSSAGVRQVVERLNNFRSDYLGRSLIIQ